MRDDLHKTYPPRTHWSRVLRLAHQQGAEADLTVALVKAVRKDAEWLDTEWGNQFEQALNRGAGDFFAREKAQAELLELNRRNPNAHARGVCEVALGCLARGDVLSLDFKDRVIREALQTSARDFVEQVAARVAKKFDHSQARQVRTVLNEHLPNCDFSQPPMMNKKASKSIDADLSMPLALAI